MMAVKETFCLVNTICRMRAGSSFISEGSPPYQGGINWLTGIPNVGGGGGGGGGVSVRTNVTMSRVIGVGGLGNL